MDLRTFHTGGVAFGRRHARVTQAQAPATPGRPDIAPVLTGSSMRVMEASLAIVAIGTALLLNLGR